MLLISIGSYLILPVFAALRGRRTDKLDVVEKPKFLCFFFAFGRIFHEVYPVSAAASNFYDRPNEKERQNREKKWKRPWPAACERARFEKKNKLSSGPAFWPVFSLISDNDDRFISLNRYRCGVACFSWPSSVSSFIFLLFPHPRIGIRNSLLVALQLEWKILESTSGPPIPWWCSCRLIRFYLFIFNIRLRDPDIVWFHLFRVIFLGWRTFHPLNQTFSWAGFVSTLFVLAVWVSLRMSIEATWSAAVTMALFASSTPTSIRPNSVALGFIGFHWVSPGFTGFN